MPRNYKFFKGINLTVLEPMHGGGEAEGRDGGAAQYMRAKYTSFKGINLTVLERMHQSIMYIL